MGAQDWTPAVNGPLIIGDIVMGTQDLSWLVGAHWASIF